MKTAKTKLAAYIAWSQAVIATSSSLYFSEILHFPPCVLCWYQRIFMYPLVLIIAVGIIRKDKNLPFYVLPLSLFGGAIAFYHYLLQRGIIPDKIAPCSLGISCTTDYIEWLGFITIPFLSLIAFAVISVCMLVLKNSLKAK